MRRFKEKELYYKKELRDCIKKQNSLNKSNVNYKMKELEDYDCNIRMYTFNKRENAFKYFVENSDRLNVNIFKFSTGITIEIYS